VSWIDQGRQYHGYFGHGTAPTTDLLEDVEDAANGAVGLLPGDYYAPLVPLMNRILAVRPGDDVSALHRAISAAFFAQGDTIGGNQVTHLLMDMTIDGANLAARRAIADLLVHYARTNPADVAAFRGVLVGEALGGAGAQPPEEVAAPEAGTAAATEEGLAPPKVGATAATTETSAAAKAEAGAQQIEAAIRKALASSNTGTELEGKVARYAQAAGSTVTGFQRKIVQAPMFTEPARTLTDIDVETDEALIEVTTVKNGKLGQVQDLISDLKRNPTRKPVILYAPGYRDRLRRAVRAIGAQVARTPEQLADILKSLRSR
jgi:hypothetical protein